MFPVEFVSRNPRHGPNEVHLGNGATRWLIGWVDCLFFLGDSVTVVFQNWKGGR